MFNSSKHISRPETVRSVALRFRLDEFTVMMFLDYYYPRLFFPLISTDEYIEFSKAIMRTKV